MAFQGQYLWLYGEDNMSKDKDVIFIYIKSIPWMLWWAIFVHIIWGVTLELYPTYIESLVVFGGLSPLVDILGPKFAGALLISAALIASFGLVNEGRLGLLNTLLTLAPQYFLLLVTICYDWYLLWSGEYMDREIHRSIIIVVLAALQIGAIFHTLNIMERYWWRWSRSY